MRHRHPESGGENLQGAEGHIAFTTFNGADVRPVEPASEGELLLRHAFGVSKRPDVGRQNPNKSFAGFAELTSRHADGPSKNGGPS